MEINPELAFKNVFAQCGSGRPIGGVLVTSSGKILYQENFDECDEVLNDFISLIPQLRVGDFLSTSNYLILRLSTGISIVLKFGSEQKVALAQLSLVGRFTAFAGWFDSLDEKDYYINLLKLKYPEGRKIFDLLGHDSNTAIGKILEIIVEKGEATKEDLIRELELDEKTVENDLEKLVTFEILEKTEGKLKIHTRLITISLAYPNSF
ncbi:MAG: hypothetical protein ACUVXA_09415 [Candidatus Jordarchaeum sp.]|uniref:hypothetical protein n=1 Tax=Candidatus Jordarchaeum sp. TaxID=2823881 RepID=UPI00404A6A21